jgi:hypothetical protein
MLAADLGAPLDAVPYLRQAAAEATARTAYEEAATHLRDAVRLAGDATTARDLLVDLGDALRYAGELTGARACYRDAAAEAKLHADRHVLARAALGAHRIGVPTWASHERRRHHVADRCPGRRRRRGHHHRPAASRPRPRAHPWQR